MSLALSRCKIALITFDEVLPIWQRYLWPNRQSAIEPTSGIKFGTYPYEHDPTHDLSHSYCFGALVASKLIGVNTGHVIGDTFRSRGLYVFPDFRKCGIGTELLLAAIDQGSALGCRFTWSMPRRNSFMTYQSAGFLQTSDWFETETSESNCFASTTQ